ATSGSASESSDRLCGTRSVPRTQAATSGSASENSKISGNTARRAPKEGVRRVIDAYLNDGLFESRWGGSVRRREQCEASATRRRPRFHRGNSSYRENPTWLDL